MTCTAHRLELSVRKVLDLPYILPILSMIRQPVNFFRISRVPATYLKNAFEESIEFKRQLPPLLDFKKSLSSTLSISNRYLKIDSLLQTFHDKIVNERVRISVKGQADPLTPLKRHTFVNLTTGMRNVEESTSSLATNSATNPRRGFVHCRDFCSSGRTAQRRRT